MGLDATVYCDCFETGRLREPPPLANSVYVAPDGSLGCKSNILEDSLAFDQWLKWRACEHEDGVLLHHYLGNIALIGALRAEIKQRPSSFKVLLEKVIYNGVHAGDHLSQENILLLREELNDLDTFQCNDPEMALFVRHLHSQLNELIAAALSVKKPIAF